MTYKTKIVEILQTQIGERKMQVRKAERIADALIENDVIVQNHGKWVKLPNGWANLICSICFGMSLVDAKGHPTITNYCPNCGARMDGDAHA